MEVIYPRCAGLDVHKQTVVACVRIAGDGAPLQEVRTLCHHHLGAAGPGRLARLASASSTSRMEATGVYWKPVWHVLEGHFELVLANAAHVKNVPGRKTDVNDAMWLADLLAHGLIRASFVPPQAMQELRALTRTRKQFVRERSRARAAHREGARGRQPQDQRRAQRHHGQERPRGAAGHHRRARRSRAAGSRAISPRVKASRAELLEALRGRITRAPPLHAQAAPGAHRGAGRSHRRHRKGGGPRARSRFAKPPDCLSTMPGLSAVSAQRRRGRNRRRHVALRHPRPPALLGLPVPAQRRKRRQAPQHPAAPRRHLAQDHAGAGRLGRRTRQGQLPASAVPRLRARRGAKKAIIAVAASMLTAAWHMLRNRTDWHDLGAAYFDHADRQKTINRLLKRLRQLGVDPQSVPA